MSEVKQLTERIWTCKIGGPAIDFPHGADAPMRNAVNAAFERVTGMPPAFTFSGWGGKLDEGERAVVENRRPSEEHYRACLVREAAPKLLDELINLTARFKAAIMQAGTDEEFAEFAVASARAAIAKALGEHS